MYVVYNQGAYPPGVAGYGPVQIGMKFTPLTGGIYKGMTPFGVIGATYAVTAVVNDPLNPLPSGVVSENSGDQATLSGILDTSLWPGTGTPGVTVVSNTVPASWFENTYRVK